MKKTETTLPGVIILEPRVFQDSRGYFMESYNQNVFHALGIPHHFVQDNHSLSLQGVLRGLHYQIGKPQAKLVRVTRGEIFDVAVDIRRNSPSFGKWTSVRLSEENKKMLFIPEGFAHGFYTLSKEAEVLYKCSALYDQAAERGLIWNDPTFAIEWPLLNSNIVQSDKDLRYPSVKEIAPEDLPLFEPKK